MKSFLIFLICWATTNTLTQAQSLNLQQIENGATEHANLLFTILKKQNQAALQTYIIDLATLQTLARGYSFSSAKEKTNFASHADIQQARMQKSVQLSYTTALSKLKTQGVDLKKCKVLATTVEIKKDREVPTTRVTVTIGNSKEQHTLYIDGLAYHNGKWWLVEGYNYWK